MPTASLKSRIDKLFNAMGTAARPSDPAIRGILSQWSAIAESLESEQSTVEAEKKITALEATVKELQTVLEAEKVQSKAQLDYADAQLKQLQGTLEAAKEEIRRAQQKDDENEPLSLLDSEILFLLDRSGQTLEENLAVHLKAGIWAIRNAIEDLRVAGLLTTEYDPNNDEEVRSNPLCGLTKKGKAWLVRNRSAGDSAVGIADF